MKVAIALCLLFVCVYSAPTFNALLDEPWTLFKRVHEKRYTSVEEEINRYEQTNSFLVENNYSIQIVDPSGKLILRWFVIIILKLIMVYIPIHWKWINSVIWYVLVIILLSSIYWNDHCRQTKKSTNKWMVLIWVWKIKLVVLIDIPSELQLMLFYQLLLVNTIEWILNR